MSGSKNKIILSALLIFASGVAIGGMGTGIAIRHRLHTALAEGSYRMRFLAMHRLSSRLDLTPEQARAIEPAVVRAESELRALRLQHQPEIDAIFVKAIEAIRPNLSAGQQQKLDTRYQRMKKHFSEASPPPADSSAP